MLCIEQTISKHLQCFSEIFCVEQTIYGESFQRRLLSTLLFNAALSLWLCFVGGSQLVTCSNWLAQGIARDTPSRQLGVSLDFAEHTVIW